MKTPQQILQELQQLQEISPDLYKKVGNVLFGGSYYLTKLQGVRPSSQGATELNTEWEEDLLDTIYLWLDTSSNTSAAYFKKNKAILDQLAKEFPALLRPPIGETAYRGTAIKIDSLEQAFRKKKFEVIRLAGREVFHFKNLGYAPKRPAQSWTTSPKVAFNFEGKSGLKGLVPVVYATKVNKDFIFSPDLLNTMFKLSGGSNAKEYETVRIGGEGTFEAFVDSSIIANNWRLEPKDNFIHKLPSAKPFFDVMVDQYNKKVTSANRGMGEEIFRRADNINDVIKYSELDETPGDFYLHREYAKYVSKYIKSLKND